MIDKKTTNVLKCIKKNPDITLSALYDKFGESAIECVQKLVEERYVKEHISRRMELPELDLHSYAISIDGNAYLENHRLDAARTALDAISKLKP